MVIVENQACLPKIYELILQERNLVKNNSQNLFDNNIVQLFEIVEQLLSSRGVCRLMIHFSKNQLTCWAYGESNGHKMFTAEDVFNSSFMAQFQISTLLAPLTEEIMPTKIPMHKSHVILEEFWRLRATNKTMRLRSAYINRINGSLSLTFECAGKNYILYSDTFDTINQCKFISQVA
jgi:hypothetical protein